MMKRIIVFIFCMITTFSFHAYALTRAPQTPWEKIFDDYNRIFYMTPLRLTPDSEFDEVRLQIKSGLYHNTEPLENIYYVDEYFYESIVFSNDGMQFADVRGLANGAYAIGFYNKGSLVKSYEVSDLLKNLKAGTHVAGGIIWEEWQKREFDEQQGILTVVTVEGRNIAFDIATGSMLNGNARTKPPTAIIISSIVLLVVIVIVFNKRGMLKIRSKPNP